MTELKVNHGYLGCNERSLKGKKVLTVTESALIEFSDFVENLSTEKVFKDGSVWEFIGGNTFKISGIQYGDEPWHYAEINDEYINVVMSSEVAGIVFDFPLIEGSKQIEFANNFARAKPIKTYIMIDTANNFYKIGKSINPEIREKTLQSEKPTIEIYLVCSDDIEKILHLKYKSKRVRGEWFSLTQDDLINLVLEHNFEKVYEQI